MIVVTGAAGFIGSCLIKELNSQGYKNIVAVDDFSDEQKMKNLKGKFISHYVHRDPFFLWLDMNYDKIEAIYHIGARTDTTEADADLLNRLNLFYTRDMFSKCAEYKIPLAYASSAAVYGDGSHGYDDEHSKVNIYTPLNQYGISKNEIDKWVLTQENTPPFWAGVRFFNVYGPNEYHKKRMASVIMNSYNQIMKQGWVNLFKSHRPDIAHGEQKRDFIYVKDVVSVLVYLMKTKPDSGIYNLGTGIARAYNSLTNALFMAIDKPTAIKYIDTPIDIRDKYQYFTEAKMDKLINAGYNCPFYTLEEGIADYVKNYLDSNEYC